MSWGFFFVGLPPYATWTWTQMASVLRLRKLTSDMAYRKTIDTSGENPRVRGIAKLRATGISKVPYIIFMAHPESKENALFFFPIGSIFRFLGLPRTHLSKIISTRRTHPSSQIRDVPIVLAALWIPNYKNFLEGVMAVMCLL